MKVIKLSYPHEISKLNTAETVAAIGFFDGIHLGHQTVIQTAIDQAKKQHTLSSVITFYPHPSVVLKNNGEPVRYITPEKEKVALLEKMDVDMLYIIEFSKAFSQLSPQDFVDHYIKALHVTHLVAGFDFSFGFKGAGNMNNIATYANGEFQTTIIEKIMNDEGKISSTNIRKLLKAGDMESVTTMLGRQFTTKGLVVRGDQRGRTIGFPTANLAINPDALMPKQGVYAVEVVIEGSTYTGMANLGVIPTFKDKNVQPTLEIYIFDFDANIYDKEMEVIWYQHMRDEVKFSGVEALVEQLKTDERNIRLYFK